jgi:hypothetical protein
MVNMQSFFYYKLSILLMVLSAVKGCCSFVLVVTSWKALILASTSNQ